MKCACVSSPILCQGIKAKIEHLSYAATALQEKHPCETNINFHVDNITEHNNQHKVGKIVLMLQKCFIREFTAKHFSVCRIECSMPPFNSFCIHPPSVSPFPVCFSRASLFTHSFRKLRFPLLRGKFQRRKYSLRRFRKTFDFHFYHKQIEEETLNLR